jgi:hypothetical protein
MPIVRITGCGTSGMFSSLRGVDMTDRRSLELFGIWLGFAGGTVLWTLIGVSGVTLSLSRAVFMFAATVLNFGAVVRALRLASS